MKKLFFVLTFLAMIFTACEKTDDVSLTDPQNTAGELRSSSIRPFEGAFEGLVWDEELAPVCLKPWKGKHYDGNGQAIHCGNSTLVLDYCVLTYQQYGNFISNGSGTLTAANGDKIYLEFAGLYDFDAWPPFPYGPGTVVKMQILSGAVTGGTGRFEGATGTITQGGGEQPDLTTGEPWFTTIWFKGSISY
jgi:hypothetical protein